MDQGFFSKLTRRTSRSDGSPNGILCVGLDPYLDERAKNASATTIFTQHCLSSGTSRLSQIIYKQCCDLVDETSPYAAAFKPNIAFFEALGKDGFEVHVLQAVCNHISADIPVLLDAKRGDIGNTAEMYARCYFSILGVDAITVNPYMGTETVLPFLSYPGKAIFALCKTSNPGSSEFQQLNVHPIHPNLTFSASHTVSQFAQKNSDQTSSHLTHPTEAEISTNANSILPLYMEVAKKFRDMSTDSVESSKHIGLVVGATDITAMAAVRNIWKDVWLLTPGIGAQGGDLSALLTAGDAFV
ncbi:orotidine-5-phosphate decarboxylase/orotate phosphoribosyltransferase [Cardiosporidium cionae]|uniref:Orotidine 5'-phosphate decarboxylase n=1 Tax=Cardiosporidium cionae TaxID=476202 RepID=A0ABQ7J816_9APIC|nr:orotidine-5-phosphate decarboxylase/orotate phosphoribosyltransferase [Cardiosporidium cionae]|eukprot:KAF8820079.1 orotidine-5-phosphate decarboxylase/orotate phosphoribosyltransferase [Cardiosporidium cionae]